MAKAFAEQFYKSIEWKHCRAEFVKSRRGLCENCLAKGIITPGVIVHHVEELTPENIYRPEISLSWGNLKLLCRQCHADVHDYAKIPKRYMIGPFGEVTAK